MIEGIQIQRFEIIKALDGFVFLRLGARAIVAVSLDPFVQSFIASAILK